MKKSLIALAVAGLVSAPAFAATANVDVYGQVRLSVDSVDGDLMMKDQTSRVGIKGAEDLGGGLKAFYNWEQKLSFATGSLDTGAVNRLAFAGLAGNFGSLSAGSVYLPYKSAGSASVFEDTSADTQGAFVGAHSLDKPAIGINYVSPSFSGVTVSVGLGTETGSDLGDTTNVASLSDETILSAAVSYANGPMTLGLALQDGANANNGNIADTTDAWKLNAGYKFGELGLKATYESADVANVDKDNWVLSATYGMGPITLAGQYVDSESANEEMFVVAAIYSLSKRTNAHIAYATLDNADVDVITLQLNHSF